MKPIKIKSSFKYEKNSSISKLYINRYYYQYIIILLFLIFFIFIVIFLIIKKSKYNNKNRYKKIEHQYSKLIDENFFIIDSNYLDKVQSHMYGFSVSPKGILTNNYYKKKGHYEEPEPQGVFIMIRKIGDEIILNQDFYGSFGIYIYENKNAEYFALSNSFLLLEEYLVGKQNFTLNKDFADSLIISELCSPSIYETMVKEIIMAPSNSFIIINTKRKSLKIYSIDYNENSVPFESEEGLKIIDKWVDKWSYILRSLKKQTNNISSDLTGGFDTRTVLSILLNSGIDLNEILIYSINNTIHNHEEDFKIANNISLKFGFKLNNMILDNNGTKLSTKDSLFCTIYSKLGFHKEFYSPTKFLSKPRFVISGKGGEIIRGYPGYPIKKYMKKISKSFNKDFYDSSMRICNRSLTLLKKKKTYYNDFEISADFYSKGRTRHHYGKSSLEGFLVNSYSVQPLIDPDIKQIKFEINEKSLQDLIAYIYVRFAHDLINFPFEGKRELNPESIIKAEKLNKKFRPYRVKSDYNENFYIDIERKSPILPSNDNKNVNEYLRELFKTSKFINIINRLYDNNVYNWAKEYSKKSNYYPLRHGYALFAIAKTLEDLSLNERYFNSFNGGNLHSKEKLIN